MRLYKCAFLCALLALSIFEPVTAKRSFGSSGGRSHTYPRGGLSGSGHSYPSSGGLSGSGHGYPPSGGLSGGGHGYPSSGSKYPSSGGSHSYPPAGGSHSYPSSGGLSGSGTVNTHHTGSHGYPAGKGLSGNSGSSTNYHYHYHYNPPKQISYTPVHGGAPVSYPVYHGTPPTYVYKYKDSGSKYGTLLAGLALLNLGTLAGTAYVASQVGHGNNGGGGASYKPQAGEICKFAVKKENGDYEETKIDCQLISSFILEEQAKTQSANKTTITSTTVTNVTTINSNGMPVPASVNQTTNPRYEMLPNGTIVPITVVANQQFEMLPNGTLVPINLPVNPQYEMLPDGTLSKINVTSANVTIESPSNPVAPSVTSVTTTTNTTTVQDALDVKGKPIDVTPGMECYVIRTSPTSKMRRSVPCGLLKTYADKSISRNSVGRNVPTFSIVALILATFVSTSTRYLVC